MTTPPLASPLDPFLRALPPPRLRALADRFAARAYDLGLAVTRPDGSTLPIPPVLSPAAADEAWLDARVRAVGRLIAATGRAAEKLLLGPEREAMLSAMAPFERRCAEAIGVPRTLATVRADLFLEPNGHARALELNATIPAMQGYSDIAARAFLEALAPELGMDQTQVDALVQANGENAMALLGALAEYHRARTGRPLASIALVHRPQDAQLTELRYLARRWEQAGLRARTIAAGEIEVEQGNVRAAGESVDLVYRHIFARRVEPEWALAGLLLNRDAPLLNPVSSALEMKRTFAELSRSAAEPALAQAMGFGEEEVTLLRDLVPWTRPLRRGPATGPEGGAIDDLVAHVAGDPASHVIKRSWDYGGKAVFLGFEHGSPAMTARCLETFGADLDWPSLVGRAADDPRGGGFVVQRRVESAPRALLLCEPEGPAWRELYMDLSVYGSAGLSGRGWGGVCRASRSAVVNIVGGGGVVPLLKRKVADALLAKG